MENILLDIRLDQVEFSDCKVLGITLDYHNKIFKIMMEEIFNLEENKFMDNILLIGIGWDNIKISGYNDINKETFELKKCEEMEIISEIRVNKNKIIFCGFGKYTGNWIEIIFDNLLYNLYKME